MEQEEEELKELEKCLEQKFQNFGRVEDAG